MLIVNFSTIQKDKQRHLNRCLKTASLLQVDTDADDFEDRQIDCPVCMFDLTRFSIKQRQQHITSCLEPSFDSQRSIEIKSNSPKQSKNHQRQSIETQHKRRV